MLSKAEISKKLTDSCSFDSETTPFSLRFSALKVWTGFTHRADLTYHVFRREKSATSTLQNVPMRGKDP